MEVIFASLIYYSCFFALFALLIYMGRTTERLSAYPMFALWLLLTIFAGMRFGPGRDFSMYLNIYEYGEHTPNYHVLEPFWKEMIDLFRRWGVSSAVWFTTVAGLTYALLIYGFRRLCGENWWIAILAFVLVYSGYFETFNIMRQYLALGIMIASYPLMQQKRYLWFALCLVGAFLVHSSAAIILPMLLIARIKWNKYILAALLVFSPLLSELLLPSMLDLLGNILPDRYGIYTEKSQVSKMQTETGLYPLFLMFVALYFVFSAKRISKYRPEIYPYINSLVFAVIIYSLFKNFETGVRIFYYPFAFFFPLLALTVKPGDKLKRQPAIVAILLVFSIFTCKNLSDINESYSKYRNIYDTRRYRTTAILQEESIISPVLVKSLVETKARG
ncbi:exopolysaccharide synthesis-related protein [Porphyromonas crevioricanis JCM 15906]|uniref:EpsG family protein n=2 Tax=Porphyromonas crevioricanis TaxID=393921 RepID=A0A2X4PLF4_9PORP|nr:EpsG family protein [Porphyromonas crevioricanis]KGN96132.1 hypothetical protein HQ38_02140 [Porphyromonas crevioricanis]SKA02998.1 EpsG family protein [Porphyromonas crevioricanis]SQH72623.1 Uncharacterised protein [Porphyromonas crevioricanis]GAD05891.1 exopolysaccharide synthesis-related protein [Porphyromonas crevioricanis JCM 15906]GAD07959.1 exopolysaccharide synthesis-related protein [Porphyromonas crevioricanis JCM 13913]